MFDQKEKHKGDAVLDVPGCKIATIPERRNKPRVNCSYPATMQGIDHQGDMYMENGQLANLSASGLYMLVNRNIENGSNLSVTVLLTSTSIDEDTPKIATIGIVVRTEPQVDGTCGIGVKFSSYRFL